MGGLLSGAVVPVADVLSGSVCVPLGSDAHQAMDGALGSFIRDEMRAKESHGFEAGAFDNGMRTIGYLPAGCGALRSQRHAHAYLRASCSTTCFDARRGAHDREQHRYPFRSQVRARSTPSRTCGARRLLQAVKTKLSA